MYCPVCGGLASVTGRLGNTAWCQCRDCGLWFVDYGGEAEFDADELYTEDRVFD